MLKLGKILRRLGRLAAGQPKAPVPAGAHPAPIYIGLAHWSEADRAVWERRWPHFSARELASKGDGSLRVHSGFIDMLEGLRALAGRPLHVTSCYRDPAHNARVGGAPLSRHKVSDAVDIRTRGWSLAERKALARAARAIGFQGVGVYLGFLHFDARPQGPASWFGSSAARRAWLGEA